MAERGSRRIHETQTTIGDMHRTFGEAIGMLGMHYADEEATLRMHRLPFEGTPFGDRAAQLRRPGSKFFEKSYLEAQAVARALVSIGADEGVADVRRAQPPAPDVTVDYGDHHLYVEHAMILDEVAMAVDVSIEDANFALHELADVDPILLKVFGSGIFGVRLQNVDVAKGVNANDLCRETAALARSVQGDTLFEKPDPSLYPVLTAHDARVSYRTCPTPTGSVIETEFLDRWPEYEPTLRRILNQKYTKRTYDPRCRPLWLLLSLGFGFELMPGLRGTTSRVIKELGTAGFDRVIVQLPRDVPLTIEPQSI
jgi:hypothetical protein